MKETTVAGPKGGIFNRAFSEIRHFGTYPFNMRVLLLTNMLYAFVLPVVELSSARISCATVRSWPTSWVTSWPSIRASPSFFFNGFLMRHVRITHLYSFGMLLSGVSMAVMMSLETLALGGIIVAGAYHGPLLRLLLGQPRLPGPEFDGRR